jgi:hypothetical protein
VNDENRPKNAMCVCGWKEGGRSSAQFDIGRHPTLEGKLLRRYLDDSVDRQFLSQGALVEAMLGVVSFGLRTVDSSNFSTLFGGALCTYRCVEFSSAFLTVDDNNMGCYWWSMILYTYASRYVFIKIMVNRIDSS